MEVKMHTRTVHLPAKLDPAFSLAWNRAAVARLAFLELPDGEIGDAP
jgi:hypothetical protein